MIIIGYIVKCSKTGVAFYVPKIQDTEKDHTYITV
jgi:hypothetical protein